MSRNISVPENDWISMNIRFDDIERRLESISSNAVTSSGLTISEYEKLNREQKATVKNASSGTEGGTNSDTPTNNPRPVPTPTPGQVPTIREFSVFPTTGIQGPNIEKGFFAIPVTATIIWDVINADTIRLIQTPIIRGEAVTYTLIGYMGIKTITVSQETSFVLQATNSSGTVGSKEFKVECRNTDIVDPVDPVNPPSPEGIPIPTGLAGSANGLILVWTWTEVSNADKQSYQLYASKTTGFDPDTNPPADLTYRVSFGNHTNTIATGAAETWYAKVRQVAKTGKSGLSAEASATST